VVSSTINKYEVRKDGDGTCGGYQQG